MALLGVPCGGCLVTDEYTFPGEPNEPPVILSKTGHPEINTIIWIDREQQTEWPLEVRVRDENVDQPLRAHWRITHQDAPMPPFTPQEIMISNEPIRELTIRVNTAVLRPYRCHQLELAVSGSFSDFNIPELFGTPTPGHEGDLAIAKWWIWEGEGPLRTPDGVKPDLLDSCPAIESMPADMRATEATQP